MRNPILDLTPLITEKDRDEILKRVFSSWKIGSGRITQEYGTLLQGLAQTVQATLESQNMARAILTGSSAKNKLGSIFKIQKEGRIDKYHGQQKVKTESEFAANPRINANHGLNLLDTKIGNMVRDAADDLISQENNQFIALADFATKNWKKPFHDFNESMLYLATSKSIVVNPALFEEEVSPQKNFDPTTITKILYTGHLGKLMFDHREMNVYVNNEVPNNMVYGFEDDIGELKQMMPVEFIPADEVDGNIHYYGYVASESIQMWIDRPHGVRCATIS